MEEWYTFFKIVQMVPNRAKPLNDRNLDLECVDLPIAKLIKVYIVLELQYYKVPLLGASTLGYITSQNNRRENVSVHSEFFKKKLLFLTFFGVGIMKATFFRVWSLSSRLLFNTYYLPDNPLMHNVPKWSDHFGTLCIKGLSILISKI